MSFTRRTMLTTTFAAAAFASERAQARAPEIYLHDGGVFGKAWTYAADGYDVVSYHTLAADAAPVKGDETYRADYKGVSWLFSSQENLDAFNAEPDKYRPRYGGYCAWAMARNKLAKGDPAVWHIHQDALYFNISPRYRRQWLANVERDIARADEYWPAILTSA